MAYTYEEMIPSPLENITVEKAFYNDVHRSYRLRPNEGYVMHDKLCDVTVIDEETLIPTGEILPGYIWSYASVGANYDFVTNPREFYAALETDVPENQIFGGGNNNDHEVM